MKRYLGAFSAGLIAAAILWAVELWRLAHGDALSQQHLSLFDGPALNLAKQFLIPAILTGGSLLTTVALRDLVHKRVTWRRLIVPILSLPVVVWLGLELSMGTGIQRAGLGSFVVLAVPVLGTAFLYLSVLLCEALCNKWIKLSAILLIGVVVAVGYANRTMHLGRYRSVHDVLAAFEFLGAATIVLQLFFLHRVSSRKPLTCILMAVLGLFFFTRAMVLWPITGMPNETLRQVYGHDGFHSERLLYWRRKLGAHGAPIHETDQELLDGIRNWQELAADYHAQLDQKLPNRRTFNLVWISIDTLRPDRLGCYGSDAGLTPAIDAIAQEGAVFRDAYSQYPSTNLSSESMFFGRYPRATAIYRDIKGDLSKEDARALRFSALAKQNGMHTTASVAFTEEWMHSPLFVRALADYESVNEGRTGSPSLDGEHFANSAIKTIDRFRESRFFLWFHLFDPHHPYDFREGYAKSEGAEGRYDSEVGYADSQVARVVKKLKDTGLWDTTIIVINSDHGEAFGEQGLKYHGSSLHEAQIRVPLIIRVPGMKPTQPQVIAENVDIYPTIASLLALDGTSENQGTDLTPLMFDSESYGDQFPSFAYAELPDDVEELSSSARRTAIFRQGPWKVRKQLLLDYTELYNLDDDPWETKNLAAAFPLRAKKLTQRLHTMAKWTGSFGRKRSSRQIRHERLKTAKSQLIAKSPVAVGQALKYIARHDLFELRNDIFALAKGQNVLDEIRCESLVMAARWNAPGWRELALDWTYSENPSARWLALELIFDDLALTDQSFSQNWRVDTLRALAENAKKLGRGDTGDALLARVFVALTVRLSGIRASDDDVESDWRHLLDSHYVDRNMKRRLVLAYLDELDHLWRYLDLFSEDRERGQFLNAIWRSGRRAPWLDVVRVLIPDRYLRESIKHDILRHISFDFPIEIQNEVALFFLAGWDPGFHEEVLKELLPRLGKQRIEHLQIARSLMVDGDELLHSGHFEGAVEAFGEAETYLVGLAIARQVTLKRIKALMLAGQGELAEKVLRSQSPYEGAFRLPALEREFEVLGRYHPSRGLLLDSEKIEVESVALAPAAERFVVADQDLFLSVALANNSSRSLPGGAWGLGGRLRVLWSRDGKTNWEYGTQVDLGQGILPQEKWKQEIVVQAPNELGHWYGRVIVNQQGGARFYQVEDARGLFEVNVVRAHQGPPSGSWNPVEMAKYFEFDERLRDPLVAKPGGTLELMALGYEGAFRTPPLSFDGNEHEITIDYIWDSAIESANLIRIDLLPAGAFPPVDSPIILNIPCDGSPQKFQAKLPRCIGLYRVEVWIGYRQGYLQLQNFTIR